MAVTVSFRRPYARSICSIFPLRKESNALKKCTNKSITSRFFAHTPSKIQWIVGIYDVMDQLLWKPLWFFLRISKNFLNFWFNAIELQSIINLSRYGSKGYGSVVLSNCKVTFLGERVDTAFCSSLYHVLAIYSVAISEQ